MPTKKVNRKINVSDADKIVGTSDADVYAFRVMQDNISRIAQSMNFMRKAWMEIAEQKQAEKRSGGKRTSDSLDVQQTSAKKQKMTVEVTNSPPSAKKQKIADHISDSEESDIEEYDTEGEISENSSDAEDSDVDEIMTL